MFIILILFPDSFCMRVRWWIDNPLKYNILAKFDFNLAFVKASANSWAIDRQVKFAARGKMLLGDFSLFYNAQRRALQ